MVNDAHTIYIERHGKITRTNAHFVDEQHLLRIIDKIISRIGRRIDESSPYVDARLPDGSRVNAIIPPLAVRGSALTIRKFRRDPFTMPDLIKFGTLTHKSGQFLEACVRGKLNILISGGTGSGKTTTLNVLSSAIPSDERIITVEDAAELQLKQDHVITLESRPSNIEGKGQVTIRDLVRNTLRMRPDRIIVGECRGPETVDMLQAMNTGHDGSLTTVHANNPRDALARTETLVLTAGVDLPLRAIREQISSAFDLIVQVSRLVDGTRRITHVTEVLRMESDVVTLQDIFIAKPVEDVAEPRPETGHRLLGPLTCTGIKPHFLDKMAGNGVNLPPELLPARYRRAASVRRGRVRTGGGSVMRRAIAVATTAVALLAASSASASGGTLTVKSIDTSKFPTVAVTVQTTGTNGTTPQFRVTENGRPAVNPSSGGGEPPAAIALLVDTSRSMAGQKMHDAIASAKSFVDEQPPNNIVGVYGFDAKPYTAAPLSNDPSQLDIAIQQLNVDGAPEAPRSTAPSSWPPTTCRASSRRRR